MPRPNEDVEKTALLYYGLEAQLLSITNKISPERLQHFAYLERMGVSDINQLDLDRFFEAVIAFWKSLPPEYIARLDQFANDFTYAERMRMTAVAQANTYREILRLLTPEQRRFAEEKIRLIRKAADEAELDDC